MPQDACNLRYYPGRAGTRRNPGRMDKFAYNGSWFICPEDIDGRHDDHEHDASQEIIEFEDILAHEGSRASQPIVISLIEIARPAKAKGMDNPARQTFIILNSNDFQGLQRILKLLILHDA
jgi:hypothetical protein